MVEAKRGGSCGGTQTRGGPTSGRLGKSRETTQLGGVISALAFGERGWFRAMLPAVFCMNSELRLRRITRCSHEQRS